MMTRLKKDFGVLLKKHREKIPYVAVLAFCLVFYLFMKGREEVTRVYQSDGKADFKDARVLGSQGDSLYENKERLLSKTLAEFQEANAAFKETTAKLDARIGELEKKNGGPGNTDENSKVSGTAGIPPGAMEKSGSQLSDAPSGLEVSQGAPGSMVQSSPSGITYIAPNRGGSGRFIKGSAVISFPVKEVSREKTTGVVIPPGSYVKAKLMTGVEAPEGRTYPVLMQLDYAYIVSNKKRLDLSGCFMIAKSQGDLSTERVQMQATKLSCVGNDGKMFERDVNGFVADDKDNSFAVVGSVNTKQDRVATMAFLSSVVEGVGKGIQQAQTTQSMNPLGGTSSIVTGSQMAYLGAGGAATAAGQVTQWYLRQAQNLLPTINVGSGQDVWVVMQETVRLPNDYFRKNSKGATDEGVYSYFTRLSE